MLTAPPLSLTPLMPPGGAATATTIAAPPTGAAALVHAAAPPPGHDLEERVTLRAARRSELGMAPLQGEEDGAHGGCAGAGTEVNDDDVVYVMQNTYVSRSGGFGSVVECGGAWHCWGGALASEQAGGGAGG